MTHGFLNVAILCLSIRVAQSSVPVANSISVPGPLLFQWGLVNDTGPSPQLKLQLSFVDSGSDEVWAAVGITGSSLSLSNTWQTIVLVARNGSCSVRFATARNSQFMYLEESDPWSVKPLCLTNSANGQNFVSFYIGGSSSVIVPEGPTYLMFSSSFIPKFNYALVDLFSGDSQFVTGDPDKPDPWLIAHGAVFILDFSILMPIASFIILWNREKFYAIHNALGVIILVLLVVGWASLTNANKNKEAGNIYLPLDDSAIGRSHSLTGIIGRFVAVGVCFLGVILAVVRMPKTVRPFVRWSHGIVGCALSIYGPFVVWNGWVRMGVTYNTVLDTSPFIWLLIVILLLIAFPVGILVRRSKDGSPVDKVSNTDSSPPILALPEVFTIVKDKEYFLFNETEVVVLASDFSHPAGNQVMQPYIGKDITKIFNGLEMFDDTDRKRTWAHSGIALAKLREMIVCTIDMPRERSLSTVVPQSAGWTTSIDEGDKTVGIIVGKSIVTFNRISPVEKFEIKLIDPLAFGLMRIGTKLRLSTVYGESGIERVYTIAQIDSNDRVIVFYIKIYPQGELSSKLGQLNLHDSVYLSGCVEPVDLESARPVLLLAGGTGIVPMLPYLTCHRDGQTSVFWWLRDPEDLFLIQEMEKILRESKTIKMHVFFTTAKQNLVEIQAVMELMKLPNLTLGRGRINASVLGEVSPNTIVVMSGPPGFISTGSEAVKALGLVENFLCLD